MHDRNAVRIEGTDRVFNRLKILFVLLLPMAMSLMAVSSVNVALHTIELGLGASASDLQWILSGYALAFGISLIPAGRAGDVLGRGSFFVIGLVIFVLASLACGLATTPLALNMARIAQGFGSGVFNPQIIGMIQQYFTGPGRAKAFAVFGLVISVSVAIGPVLAGAIIAALGPESGWRGAFLANIPLGVLAIALAFVWFPFGTERRLLAARRVRRGADARAGVGADAGVGAGVRARGLDLDPVGSLLVAGAVLSVMMPFMAQGNPLAWVLLPVAGLLAWAWVAWERRYARRGRQPMVNMELFSFRSFSHGTLIAGIMFMGATSTFVVVALFLQGGLGASALMTGLVGLPNAAFSALGSVVSGRRVLTHGRRFVTLALGLMAAGSVLSIATALLIVEFGLAYGWLAVPLCLNGFGMGAMGSANQTLSLEDVPRAAGGTAGGVKQTVERVGTAMGTAVITGVFFAAQAAGGWLAAFSVAFAAITVFLLAAMALAMHDERYHRVRASR